MYEISVLLAILKHDFESFDDYINQVHTYYTMVPKNAENKHLMTGLHLMFFLASNRLSDFHMLLETIPQRVQNNNAYITTPVRIEQSLMEGAYNKVVLTEKNIPSPYYAVFVQIMLDTIRREIASSIEKSFKVLTAKDATIMLLFDNDQQMQKYAQDVSCFRVSSVLQKIVSRENGTWMESASCSKWKWLKTSRSAWTLCESPLKPFSTPNNSNRSSNR